MSSAIDKFLNLLPNQLGLGPHSTRLVVEAQGAMRYKLWASAIILSATIVDVIRYEESIYDFDSINEIDEFSGDMGYIESSGYDYLTMAERKKLAWLRSMRNQLVHYEGAIEGMLGRPSDDGYLHTQADKAASAILPIMLRD